MRTEDHAPADGTPSVVAEKQTPASPLAVREVWVDFVRVFAVFCVIVLHVAGPLLYEYNELPRADWLIANFYDSCVRMCVPLFFMISGYLLLRRDESLLSFFRKRCQKVVVPLVAWTLFYVLWNVVIEKQPIPSVRSLGGLLISPAYFHLWFLYALLGVYLCVPFLQAVVHSTHRYLATYFVVLWLVAVVAIPFWELATASKSEIDLGVVSGYAGYFMLGYLLGCRPTTILHAVMGLVGYGSSVGVTFAGTWYLTANQEGEFAGYFFENFSANVVVMSASVFVLLKFVGQYSTMLTKPQAILVLDALSGASFGVFLIHIAVLLTLHHGYLGVTLTGSSGNPIYAIPLASIVVGCLSFLAVVGLRKVPVLKWLVP
ncbi:acyltransferase [Blastopirellula marina]|uniref:Acyltransferase 3 domain-containing protein n=1 Tax=Blastopirellula marina TaxID=124 RepID=A0A2S8F4P1_9BACT|nr:acyltransferase family protein [Blastopirellula marina]PQO27129.1 hypothetical protein C5Y98_28180 [Blastopirellula marina]PTL41276.1 hypothetical protein C5Y97_28195 [Blastopirellula marina]